MAEEWSYGAYLSPNVAKFGEPLSIKITRAPLKSEGPCELKLYELNDFTWVDEDNPKRVIVSDEENPLTKQSGGVDDLIATWKGEIKWVDGANGKEPRFVPKGGAVFTHEGKPSLHYATRLQVRIEGVSGAYYIPFGLSTERSYEGHFLELGVKLERGGTVLWPGHHATLVRDWRWWAASSFSPPRSGNKVKYYSNGRDYFADLAHDLLAAKKSISFTGWALSPQVRLKRPSNTEHTLAAYLWDAGRRGVRVRGLITDSAREWKGLFNNWDEAPQAWLMAHPGIEISRHRPNPEFKWDPDGDGTNVARPFWTHHQKSLIIDDQIAYVGGIDLASGRWDTDSHDLHDDLALWDHSGGALTQDEVFHKREVAARRHPRMPWQDIHSRIEGPSARDVAQNFVERWNRASDFQRKSLQKRLDDTLAIERSGKFGDDAEELRKIVAKMGKSTQGSTWDRAAKVIAEAMKDTVEGNRLFSDILNATGSAKVDFEVRVCFRATMFAARYDSYAWQGIFSQMPFGSGKSTWSQWLSLMLEPKKRDELLKAPGDKPAPGDDEVFTKMPLPPIFNSGAGGAVVQVLRSIDKSSVDDDAVGRMKERIGTTKERSILEGYTNAINLAQHYIYIETQMFISKAHTLADVMVAKIEQKMKAKEPFHVYIIVPEVYDGAPFDKSAREVNYWQWKTIEGIQKKLAPTASSTGNKVEDYFQVFCLRKLGYIVETGGNKQTFQRARVNLIYVHSKLMIVDDTFITLGSANLNGRGLLGDRDSEINVAVLDAETTKVMMGDPNSSERTRKARNVTVRKSAHDFRVKLWFKHLGVDPGKEPGTAKTLLNPTHPAAIALWRDRARLNRSLSSGAYNSYYGKVTSIGPDGKLVEDPAATIIGKAEKTGLRGFITTFDMTAETAKGDESWSRPDFLME